jgi:PDZ domain-containing protein
MIPKKDLLGGSSQQQYNQAAIQDMADSKEAAAVVALRALGYPVAEHGSGALITAVAKGSPADGVVEAGDAITSIDGTATPLATDAIAILQTHQFGDTFTAQITKANGSTVTKTLTLGSRDENGCTKKTDTGQGVCMGVLLGTKQHKFDFPFEVKIDTAGIGGPSAGLAFTLALIDELTPGELTGGVKVAVTGTIDVTGKVGEVGGVVQKTAAVRKAKAKLFLVPPQEYNDAATHAGKDLKVIKVSTLQDALAALAANGGDVPTKLASQTP